jgi:uncharacterized protein (DUF1015 family)
MKIKPLRACFPHLEKVESSDLFCDEAKNRYNQYVEDGLYEKVPQQALFIYQIQSITGEHIGLVALNEVDDFFAGKVKKHEATLSAREKHQAELFMHWGAILKPVLLTYPSVTEINAWLHAQIDGRKPLFVAKFKQGKVHHRIWAITDETMIAQAQALFSRHVTSTYIADGHHRTTTIATLHEQRDLFPGFDFDHLFCAFFATDQLDILDYNRAVELPKDMSSARFMAHLSRIFNITCLEEARRPADKHELVMHFRKEWYSLHFRPEIIQGLDEENVLLDATPLNQLVLGEMLHIKDVRSDNRVTYVDGSKGLEGLAKASRSRNKAGFALYPVHFSDMMDLADAGEILPPKSTYFEPRLKSGLLVQLLKV